VLHIGPLPLHWYGLGYAVAFLVGIQLITPFLEGRGVSRKSISNLVWWNIGVGLLGARLYFVIQQPNLGDYLRNPIEIVAVWKGGMAFFGALLACLLTTIVYCYRQRLAAVGGAGRRGPSSPRCRRPSGGWATSSTATSSALRPTCPGRCAYTNPHTFAPALGVAYQPAGAYELLGSLVLFLLVVAVLSRRPNDGVAGIVYLAAYPISQLVLFYFRSTEPVLAFGLKQAQLTALGMLLLVVPAVILLRRRYPAAFTNLQAEQPRPVRPAAEAG